MSAVMSRFCKHPAHPFEVLTHRHRCCSWFDGGYDKALAPNITALLKELQPHAVVFGGFGLTPHALGWAGTENGLAPYPAWSTWSPPPPAPPAPQPPPHCTVQAASGHRCFNDTVRGSVLPVPEPGTHDKTTLQVCAAACYEDRHQGVFNTLAGIDAGNHCFCGTESDIASAAVRAKIRPLAECEVSPCHADKQQKCGGVDRLLVYSFVCTPGDTTVALPSEQTARGPLPTSYGTPNGTVWLPAEEDFTLQTEDSWFCEYQACLRPCRSLRLS